MTRFFLAVFVFFGLALSAHAAGIIVPAEHRYSAYSGKLPACDDSSALGRITDRFAQKESEYWKSSLAIERFDRVQEISLRGNGLAYIPRRYCIARAYLNDHREHTVIYQIQEDLGMIGWGIGVEWCVVGLDRNNAYAPACSVLRPFAQRFLGQKVLVERY